MEIWYYSHHELSGREGLSEMRLELSIFYGLPFVLWPRSFQSRPFRADWQTASTWLFLHCRFSAPPPLSLIRWSDCFLSLYMLRRLALSICHVHNPLTSVLQYRNQSIPRTLL